MELGWQLCTPHCTAWLWQEHTAQPGRELSTQPLSEQPPPTLPAPDPASWEPLVEGWPSKSMAMCVPPLHAPFSMHLCFPFFFKTKPKAWPFLLIQDRGRAGWAQAKPFLCAWVCILQPFPPAGPQLRQPPGCGTQGIPQPWTCSEGPVWMSQLLERQNHTLGM